MNILIVWSHNKPIHKLRNTVLDYVRAFPKYDKQNNYFFLNLDAATSNWDYSWIKEDTFDLILFTCTFLGMRWRGTSWISMWNTCQNVFGKLSCRKVILPQDDYDNTEKIWDFIRRVHISDIYTIMPEIDHAVIYPKEKIGSCRLKTVLTGYVEERYLKYRFPSKCIDVIYRANKLPYKFGKLGQLKSELVEIFQPRLNGMNTDIKNTSDVKGAYLGDKWIKHLAMSRCILGCIGGSSIMDKDGSIGKTFDDYLATHQNASYDEAKEACFPQMPEILHGMISPRHLEAAITRTCQVLIRADYSGVLRENVDYIAVDKDYGNIDEVIEKIKNEEYCKTIAENCYNHVIRSGKYTYECFVKEIIDGVSCEPTSGTKNKKNMLWVKFRCCIHNCRMNAYIALLYMYELLGNIKYTRLLRKTND